MNSRILKDKEVSSLSMQECEILEKGMMQEKSMCRFCGFCNNKKNWKGMKSQRVKIEREKKRMGKDRCGGERCQKRERKNLKDKN